MKLNPIYREAVILRDIQDLPYEEIAKILNLSIGTVKSRINRGRAILQKYLKSIYKEN
jgi:RNA polymerase sigma-70 factor (ECF subfamily)